MALPKLEGLLQRLLRRAAEGHGFLLTCAGLALAGTVSAAYPVTAVVVPAALLAPRRWRQVALFSTLGSALGATLLVAAFHHMGWAQIYDRFPELASHAAWNRIMAWVSHYGTAALFLIAVSPLPQTPALIFFGFTHCPDVCPTTLAAMTRVLEALGPRAAEVTAIFISVDPERDTPEELKSFGSLFDPRIVLLTGSPDEIAAVVRDYHIYAAKVPIEGGGYTMDHTASVQLYDRDSRFRSAFDFHEDDAVILDKVRLVLDGGG